MHLVTCGMVLQVEADEQKLMRLQTGTDLIPPAERQKVEAVRVFAHIHDSSACYRHLKCNIHIYARGAKFLLSCCRCRYLQQTWNTGRSAGRYFSQYGMPSACSPGMHACRCVTCCKAYIRLYNPFKPPNNQGFRQREYRQEESRGFRGHRRRGRGRRGLDAAFRSYAQQEEEALSIRLGTAALLPFIARMSMLQH